MTKEEKQLLLNDLCARLPHYTMVLMDDGGVELLVSVNVDTGICNGLKGLPKPYLRPMSSMTEEECKELGELSATIENIGETLPNVPYYIEVARPEQIDWLLSHHFDFHGLIPMGLALEAPEGMYVNV